MREETSLLLYVGQQGRRVRVYLDATSRAWIITPEETTDRLVPHERTSAAFKDAWTKSPEKSLALYLEERNVAPPLSSWVTASEHGQFGHFAISTKSPRGLTLFKQPVTFQDVVEFVPYLDVR